VLNGQYEYLCLKLKGRNTRRKWKFPKDYFMKPSQCPLPHLGANTMLTFEGAGQRFDWARLPSAAVTLNASMHRLRALDVVVFNAGTILPLIHALTPPTNIWYDRNSLACGLYKGY
jgi:hypothetical protein